MKQQNELIKTMILAFGIILAGVAVAAAIFFSQSKKTELEHLRFTEQQRMQKRVDCFEMFISLKNEFNNIENWYYEEITDTCRAYLTEKDEEGNNETKVFW